MKRSEIIILILLGIFINGTPLLSQITYSGKGEVVAVRFLELKDSVDVKDFEKFALEEYNPSFNRVVPGSRNFITKSDRGVNVDSYALIITCDSQIVRNTMIPEQKSSDWLNTIMEENGLWSLWSKLGTYVTDESLSNYNDFVELR